MLSTFRSPDEIEAFLEGRNISSDDVRSSHPPNARPAQLGRAFLAGNALCSLNLFTLRITDTSGMHCPPGAGSGIHLCKFWFPWPPRCSFCFTRIWSFCAALCPCYQNKERSEIFSIESGNHAERTFQNSISQKHWVLHMNASSAPNGSWPASTLSLRSSPLSASVRYPPSSTIPTR